MNTATQSFVGVFSALVAFALICFVLLVATNTHLRDADHARYIAQCKATNSLMTGELCEYYWTQQEVRK